MSYPSATARVKCCSADADFFRDGQRGGHDGAARMRSSSGVVIIGFIGVSEFSVDDGRLDGSEENIRGHHRANIRAAIGAGEFQRHASRRKLGAGNHGGKSIEDMVLGFLQNFIGQCGVAGFAHVGAELQHHGADAAVAAGVTSCAANFAPPGNVAAAMAQAARSNTSRRVGFASPPRTPEFALRSRSMRRFLPESSARLQAGILDSTTLPA